MDVSKLAIRSVVMHSIPSVTMETREKAELTLSDVPVALDAEKRLFLERKVKAALSARYRPVVEMEESGNVAAAAIREHLQGDDKARDLVATSKVLTEQLFGVQPGGAPGGMVMVADVAFDGEDAVLIAKLDQQSGMRAYDKNESGQTIISIEFLNDLFITDGTKVFKVAFFAAPDIKDNRLSGTVADEQRAGHGVADYFRRLFLGCDYTRRSEELTQHYVEVAQGFINGNQIKDPEKRGRYAVALLSDLQSQSSEIDARKFAADHLDRDDRDAFISHMTERGVSTNSFPKKLDLVESRLKRVQIETVADIFVLASPERLTDGTIVIAKVDGKDQIKINDDVLRVANHT